MKEDRLGCLVIPILVIIIWGAIAYAIIHPPGDEDIPWLVAGVLILIILYVYRRANHE